MSSEVYFAQRRATQGGGLLEKLEQLCDAAGFGVLFGGGVVAVRLSFGEVGNTTYLRPQFAQRVVRRLRGYGAQPFVADTLSPGSARRGNAAEHLAAAAANGFAPGTMDGAPLIVADGLFGGDERMLGTDARVAAAFAEADGILALTHFTGQEHAGYCGAIYHMGFGTASLGGKRHMMSGAVGENGTPGAFQERMVDSLRDLAVAKDRKLGYVTLLVDLTPGSDDLDWSDAAVAPDIGLLASRDPVAIDQAAIDLFQSAPGVAGTRLTDPGTKDKLRDLYPGVDWEHALRYAERVGLGTRDYELMII
ncbi:MAG: putative Fe-S center protein [Cyanobacteria bacterium RYN_339]|nr:putative Fe-S center protein [Cyanobacteria bacterium RYN_339]